MYDVIVLKVMAICRQSGALRVGRISGNSLSLGLLAGLAVCIPGPDCHAEPILRTWTDLQGRELEAYYLSHDADAVTVRRKADGTEFSIPRAHLSADDNQFIAGRRQSQAEMTYLPLINPATLYEERAIADLKEVFAIAGIHESLSFEGESIIIFRDVVFLEPLIDAARKLGVTFSSKSEVLYPGFNPRSFFIYSYSIAADSFLRPYHNLLIITDIEDKVVAIQLNGGSQPSGPGTWSHKYVNFSLTERKQKFAASATIGWSGKVSQNSGVAVLRSSLVSRDGRQISTHALFLPIPLAVLVAGNVRVISNAASSQ